MKETLNANNLKGNWATLLLPVNDDETFNYQKLAEEIAMLIAVGVDGIYSNGTAGEFYNQTETEYDTVNSILAEKCLAAGMRFQIGASHPSPIISLERLKRAVALKPDAIQIILPDWVTVTDSEMLDYLHTMADVAGDIPLVLYNPPHAKRVLQPVDYELIRQVPQIIGVKLLSRDGEWVKEMKLRASHLSIFVPGHFLATGVANGIASGAYSNVACINPKAAQQWWLMMHTDINAAMEIEKSILAFFKECIAPLQQQGYSNPALDKFLAAVGGWYQVGTRLRWPYKGIPESEVPAVRERARQMIPYFFDEV
ncbi:dihydrodipicolinate synthase family protein [Mucilaginibacter boryungensis]|uniref:Dihydrodipicolinate synthase family protein n=1 Tax=Mucilaginibacter boryungensis TaxID=768480 RepID=A0ABR9XMF1_9SPHI|nr:dihydrodipicolinate synthase family protein [Mucilaginibacter boryungensis]MBE9668392.1 dihydrodipicolinate synthase family protein [Mucilaginibacter boryungensis]